MDAKRLCEIFNHPACKRVADAICLDADWQAEVDHVWASTTSPANYHWTVEDLAARFVCEAGEMYGMVVAWATMSVWTTVSQVSTSDSMPEAVFALLQKLEGTNDKA